MSSKDDRDEKVICILLFHILMLFIIFQYYDNVMQILLFANAISANMLYDPPIQLFEIRWPWPRSTPCSKKWGVSRPRWPRGSDATGRMGL